MLTSRKSLLVELSCAIIKTQRGVSQPKVGDLRSELLLALSKKLNSECFATLSANVTEGGR